MFLNNFAQFVMILIKFPHIIMVEISLFFSKMDSKIQDFQREKRHFFGKCLSNFLWFWKNFLTSSRSTLVRFFLEEQDENWYFSERRKHFFGEILSFFWRKFPFFFPKFLCIFWWFKSTFFNDNSTRRSIIIDKYFLSNSENWSFLSKWGTNESWKTVQIWTPIFREELKSIWIMSRRV